MTEQEFHKLKQLDLIQILLTQGNEVTMQQEDLKKKNERLGLLLEENDIIKAKLNDRDAMTEMIKKELNECDERIGELEETMKNMYADRRIELEDAGSIVQAALELNKIFEEAQREAEQYIRNVGQEPTPTLIHPELEQLEKVCETPEAKAVSEAEPETVSEAEAEEVCLRPEEGKAEDICETPEPEAVSEAGPEEVCLHPEPEAVSEVEAEKVCLHPEEESPEPEKAEATSEARESEKTEETCENSEPEKAEESCGHSELQHPEEPCQHPQPKESAAGVPSHETEKPLAKEKPSVKAEKKHKGFLRFFWKWKK